MSPGERRLAAHMLPTMEAAEQSMVAHADGQVRSYRWPHAGARRRGQVMLVHGWTSHALVMAAFVQPLRDVGFDVIAFDLPAHGKSSGKQLDLRLGALALQAVAERFGPLAGIITHSLGGPVALLAMEGGAPLERGLAVPSIVMIATPNGLDRVAALFGSRIGLSPRAQSALEGEIEKMARRPVDAFHSGRFLKCTGATALVVHDEDDADVPFASAEAIVAGNPQATLYATKGLGHRRIIVARQVVAAAVNFLAAARPIDQ